MAQLPPQSQTLDPLNLSLRETATELPAAPRAVEELIDDKSAPGQRRTATSGLGGELTVRRQRSLWSDAWRRLSRNKLAIIGLALVVLFALIAALAPLIAPYSQA